jgi:sec-independent protein translocase protein TatA
MSGVELLLVLLIALLALGARRLPQAGSVVGKGLRQFHRAMNEARGAIADDGDTPPAAGRPKRPARLID